MGAVTFDMYSGFIDVNATYMTKSFYWYVWTVTTCMYVQPDLLGYSVGVVIVAMLALLHR